MKGPALAAAAVLLVGTAGAALAATVRGTPGADLLRGTPAADTVEARGGDDRVTVHYDGRVDTVRCGAGRDLVNAEPIDKVAADCEVVAVQLSRDMSDAFDSQHETQVEPDSFAWGTTVVAAFQSGRAVDGGSAVNGWATSRDAGRTWTSGFLPPLNDDNRATDPVIAYDAAHGLWLYASLTASARASRLVVSRSRDALTWSQPIVAVDDPMEDYDKEWLACDNWPRSPQRGTCYLSYLDVVSGEIRTRTTTNAGASWSAPAGARPALRQSGVVNGAIPLPRPDGSVVVVFAVWGVIDTADHNAIYAIRSTDGGRTFSPPVLAAEILSEDVTGMRAAPLPSADVDATGRVWVAWHDCRFRFECFGNDIVLASSRDGLVWTDPVRAPVGSGLARVDYFTPGLAVDGDRLALVYHSRPQQLGCFEFCPGGVDVWLIESANGGVRWTVPQRLSVETMPMQWIADTAIGRMLGDYVSVSWVGGRPIPVFALAIAPDVAGYRQAIFAATRIMR